MYRDQKSGSTPDLTSRVVKRLSLASGLGVGELLEKYGELVSWTVQTVREELKAAGAVPLVN